VEGLECTLFKGVAGQTREGGMDSPGRGVRLTGSGFDKCLPDLKTKRGGCRKLSREKRQKRRQQKRKGVAKQGRRNDSPFKSCAGVRKERPSPGNRVMIVL